MDGYLDVARDVYARAAREPDEGLCCVPGAAWSLPDLRPPPIMLEMNYGCGSSVSPGDLRGEGPVLYIGVGGGLEALQLAYFRRRPGGVIAVDPVEEMRERAKQNLEEAARLNPWFRPEFVRIVDGTAHRLPVAPGSVEVAAQNCLFNIFTEGDLEGALCEVHRVLRPGGRYSGSDPIAERPLPEALRRNPTLRARCISGCLSLADYLARIAAAGFGRLTVRARRPYRLLLPQEHPEVEEPILLESVEVLAEKVPPGPRGAEVFSGRQAIYRGTEPACSLEGVAFPRGRPLGVSERMAALLETREDFLVTGPLYSSSAGPTCC